MRFVLPAPDPQDGLPFAMTDLLTAMEWASAHPSVRLRVATNYRRSPEIIQIFYSDAVLPRWILWRDHTGRLHVNDWHAPELEVHYSTVTATLRSIEASLE